MEGQHTENQVKPPPSLLDDSATIFNFRSGFSAFQGRGDGFARLLNQNQHPTTLMGAPAISAVPSSRRSAGAHDPRLTRASRVVSGQSAEGIAAQAVVGSAQQMHIYGYSSGQSAEGIAAQAVVGSAEQMHIYGYSSGQSAEGIAAQAVVGSAQQMHIYGYSSGQSAEGIAAQAVVGSAQQMHIYGYSSGQSTEGIAAQAVVGSAEQMHIYGYSSGQTAEGIAAQAGVGNTGIPSQQFDLSDYSRGSSSRKRSADDSTIAPPSQRMRISYLPSSSQLPTLPQVQVFNFAIEAPQLTGETCFICKRDTAVTPEGREEFPENPILVAVLPCGHCYHDQCLENITPADERANPPCVACSSGCS